MAEAGKKGEQEGEEEREAKEQGEVHALAPSERWGVLAGLSRLPRSHWLTIEIHLAQDLIDRVDLRHLGKNQFQMEFSS